MGILEVQFRPQPEISRLKPSTKLLQFVSFSISAREVDPLGLHQEACLEGRSFLALRPLIVSIVSEIRTDPATERSLTQGGFAGIDPPGGLNVD